MDHPHATGRRIVFRDIRGLKAHEEIKLPKADRLRSFMKRHQILPKPILIDERTGVILDGHHRYSVCKELGCTRIPCVAIDYLVDASIHVTARHPGETVTKEDVLKMGLSGNVFPAKTSKHVYEYPEMERSFPLKALQPIGKNDRGDPLRRQGKSKHQTDKRRDAVTARPASAADTPPPSSGSLFPAHPGVASFPDKPSGSKGPPA